jgi:tyrosine-protein kinase Etk/Wzc
MSDKSPNEVNLLDLIAFLLRWRKFLLTAILAVSVTVAIIAMLLTPRYRSTAVIRGAERMQQGLGSLLSAKLSSLGAIAGIGSLGEVPGEFYVLILKSRWMTEKLIEKFDLRHVYKMEKAKKEEVIKFTLTRTRYEIDPESQTVIVYAEDKDPIRAQEMTQFLVDELDKRNQELHNISARKEREYIGTRLDEERLKLSHLEDSLASFQIKSGVLNLPEQIKATIAAAAELEAKRFSLQSELEMSRQVYMHGSPEISYLQMKLASIDSSLQDLMRSKKNSDNDFDLMIKMRETPVKGLTYLRLMRDIEIQQLLVAILIQQFEQARIEEFRNTPTLMRIDLPVIATQRIWPKRGLMVGIGAIAALIFGAAIALFIEYYRSVLTDEQHPHHTKLLALRKKSSLPQ